MFIGAIGLTRSLLWTNGILSALALRFPQQSIHQGDLYRLLSPYNDRCAAYEILSEDKNTAMAFVHCIHGRPTQPPKLLRLQGLYSNARYNLTGTETLRSGSSRMNADIPIDA